MSSEQTTLIPPLRGDGHGKYRILLLGNSGSGKTTLGKELALILGLPFVSMDTLAWLPGWRMSSSEELRTKLIAIMTDAKDGWVIDGSYQSKIGTLVQDQSTDIIWLDPPLALYFPRICYRTLLRLLRLAPPCSPGCDEDYREVFFSRDSILWWSLSRHWLVRKKESAMLKEDGIHVGGKRRRIGGWGSELEAWKRSVREMVRIGTAD
ncbi:hypothetical protein BXZ70DRAFT_911976 [Cristinia sonorae]|uniref:ATPase AAA-type core domain-containing protein n=1 Tax=Cristinia sonorae TaxID=1940300 RepID=A0A8K0UXW3_9AGAR|nr:hypothetical protein BXZ70DRAFT_911976 [Cristinia sonorae]